MAGRSDDEGDEGEGDDESEATAIHLSAMAGGTR